MSGFMQALTDPGVDALLGMAQGFGAAAMPTRMPTPFGAVLGAGAGGALAGAQAGQKMQLANQQIKAADIANQRGQIGLDWIKGTNGGTPFGAPPVNGTTGSPGAVSIRGNQITDDNGRYLVSPNQLVTMGNLSFGMGDPGAAASFYGHAQTAAGGAGYAFGPNGRAFPTPGGAADPNTVATKSAAEKGFGVTPNGTLSPIAGGPTDPGYMATAAAASAGGTKAGEAPYVAPQTFKVPTVDANGHPVLDAAGRPTFHDQLMTVPQANNAATTGSGNPSYADPFPGWAKKINGGENSTGNPAAPNASGPDGTPTSSAMGNGQFLAGTWPSVIRAVRPDITAGKTDAQLMPLRADPDLAQSATEQYARQNAASLSAAGLPVNGGTVALAHMLGPGGAKTVLSAKPDAPLAMLPGMGDAIQANPSLRNMTAGQLVQKYQGSMADPATQLPGISGPPALTDAQKPYDLRPGGMHGDPMAQTILKNPELREVTNPDGSKSYVHINPASPYDAPGTPGEAAPVVMPGAPAANGAASSGVAPPTPAVAALPPDIVQGREELTKGLFGRDTDSYIAANNTQGWLNQINHAADVMNKAGPLYQTGPYADTRLHLMAGINDIARTVGITTPFDQNVMASPEELRKATTTAGFELSSHYEGHARQAAATIMNATSAVPGISNSPKGMTLVSNGINEGAQSAIDMHNYKIARFAGQDPYGIAPDQVGKRGGSGLESAEADYVKAFPASMYSDRAISTVQPFKITAQSQDEAMQQMAKYLPGTIVVLPNGKQTMVPPRAGAPPIPTYMHGYLQPIGSDAAP